MCSITNWQTWIGISCDTLPRDVALVIASVESRSGLNRTNSVWKSHAVALSPSEPWDMTFLSEHIWCFMFPVLFTYIFGSWFSIFYYYCSAYLFVYEFVCVGVCGCVCWCFCVCKCWCMYIDVCVCAFVVRVFISGENFLKFVWYTIPFRFLKKGQSPPWLPGNQIHPTHTNIKGHNE